MPRRGSAKGGTTSKSRCYDGLQILAIRNGVYVRASDGLFKDQRLRPGSTINSYWMGPYYWRCTKTPAK
jgi:hypothetical protein